MHLLVYVSAATGTVDQPALDQILETARRNNAELGVTGLLLFHEGSFIQVLEGDGATVERLYRKIARDDRHAQSEVIYRGDVEEPLFGEWTMGYLRSGPSGRLPEGFESFLTAGSSLDETADKAALVLTALGAFKEGRWRKEVEG